jgi:hypothetical protein
MYGSEGMMLLLKKFENGDVIWISHSTIKRAIQWEVQQDDREKNFQSVTKID